MGNRGKCDDKAEPSLGEGDKAGRYREEIIRIISFSNSYLGTASVLVHGIILTQHKGWEELGKRFNLSSQLEHKSRQKRRFYPLPSRLFHFRRERSQLLLTSGLGIIIYVGLISQNSKLRICFGKESTTILLDTWYQGWAAILVTTIPGLIRAYETQSGQKKQRSLVVPHYPPLAAVTTAAPCGSWYLVIYSPRNLPGRHISRSSVILFVHVSCLIPSHLSRPGLLENKKRSGEGRAK